MKRITDINRICHALTILGSLRGLSRVQASLVSAVSLRAKRRVLRVASTLGLTAAVLLPCAASAGIAWRMAGAEAAKPTVCRTWTALFNADAKPAAVVCTDRKRPKTLTDWRFIDMTDPKTGLEGRYAVGF